jgi:hypothetical protein
MLPVVSAMTNATIRDRTANWRRWGGGMGVSGQTEELDRVGDRTRVDARENRRCARLSVVSASF